MFLVHMFVVVLLAATIARERNDRIILINCLAQQRQLTPATNRMHQYNSEKFEQL